MTREETRAYSRGYSTAANNRWHAHKPPAPPMPVIAEVMAAAQALRDVIDGELAKFEAGDPMAEAIYPHVDRLDAALIAVTAWLTAPDDEPEPAKAKKGK